MQAHKVWWVFNTRILGHKLHFLHGSRSWELQVSKLVIHLHYRGIKSRNPRIYAWFDSYGYKPARG